MNRLRIAGALWLVAAGFAIAMTLTFRTDPLQWVVTMAISVVAAVVGLWQIARPGALVVSASNTVSSDRRRRTHSPSLHLGNVRGRVAQHEHPAVSRRHWWT